MSSTLYIRKTTLSREGGAKEHSLQALIQAGDRRQARQDERHREHKDDERDEDHRELHDETPEHVFPCPLY